MQKMIEKLAVCKYLQVLSYDSEYNKRNILVFVVFAPIIESSKYRDLRIAFYHGKSFLEYESFPITSLDQIVNHKSFDNKKTTLLYIHGFRENLTSESVQTIVWAFIARGSHNILVLDWSDYAAGNYITEAVPNLMKVGRSFTLKCFNDEFFQIGEIMGKCVYFLLTLEIFDLTKLHGNCS